jgi:hypothetical protein
MKEEIEVSILVLVDVPLEYRLGCRIRKVCMLMRCTAYKESESKTPILLDGIK